MASIDKMPFFFYLPSEIGCVAQLRFLREIIPARARVGTQ